MKTCNINNKLLNIFQLFVSDFSNRYGYLTVSFSLLDIARRRSALDSHYDFIADRRVATLRAAKHTDTKHFLCTAVIMSLTGMAVLVRDAS